MGVRVRGIDGAGTGAKGRVRGEMRYGTDVERTGSSLSGIR